MNVLHKFAVKTAVLDEVYTVNHSSNLYAIHNAWYPFNKCVDGYTVLLATTPEKLGRVLLEDNTPFSYESYDDEESNTKILEQKIQDLQNELDNVRRRHDLLSIHMIYNYPKAYEAVKAALSI